MNDKFFNVVKSDWLDKAKLWKSDLPWLRYSRAIALEIIEHLHKNQISRENFAISMGLSDQETEIILKGEKDFTLSEISKLENFLSNSQMPVKPEEEWRKELEHLERFLEFVEKKLGNERFMQNARPEVIQLEQKKRSDALEKIRTIRESLTNPR